MVTNVSLALVHGIATAWFIFASRVAPESSLGYIKCAPEFTYITGLFSWFFMPIVILIVNMIFLITWKGEIGALESLIVLIMCNMGVALLNNILNAGVVSGDL